MTLQDIITADNPERYALRYQDKVRGGTWLIMLQIGDEESILMSTRETENPKGTANVLWTGEIEDFCRDYDAVDYSVGSYFPEIALLHYYLKAFTP